MMRALLAALLYVACALQLTGFAHAQTQAQGYPNRIIKMVVPFPAGGPTDAMARIISDRLGQVLGQTVVVENRGGGAGGSIGGKFVATADPDGYTILITPGGALTSGPAMHSNIGYDPLKAFVPICEVIETPQIMAVQEDMPVKTVAELVAYAKANPGKLSWGTQGVGTAPHLLAELFKLETKVNVVIVPYRGTAPMLAAIVGGEIQMVVDPMMSVLPHLQSGKVRGLAIAGATRHPKLPNIPTAAEAGYPKLLTPFWLGVVAPAGTPSAIIDKLNAAFRESLAPAETRARIDALGADVKIGTPAEFGKMLADELALWTGVVKAAHLQVE
jgi:tripartite-type tricarboxylate transporter receptor subunit TctC